MQYDVHSYRYPSKRTVVYAQHGMVCSSQPLAAQAGLNVLRKGGNAVDAAIATAAALTVVEPTSNGIGGDAFALVWHRGKLYGLNASGPAPDALSLDALADPTKIRAHEWESVTVPGVPAAWAALSDRFGVTNYKELFTDAIDYARNGFPVSPTTAHYWKRAYTLFAEKLTDPKFRQWFTVFAPKGDAPKAGEVWHSPGHAATLASIADSFSQSFYRGELAEMIEGFARKTGGFITKDDLARYAVEWVTPISVPYKGYDVWEIPPNGQGMVALAALGMLAEDTLAENNAATTHLQIEALKYAFSDARAYITERKHMPYTPEALVSPAYLRSRRALLTDEASLPMPGSPDRGGTVYLATADNEGTMVSYIQSNYMGFGSGLVVPGTGIALHNRGHNFSTEAGHPNCLAPGKKPYHTIIPGFLTRNNDAVGPFGVMGGFMQPQGHLQVLMNTIDFACNPQEALDAPRFQWTEGKKVMVEPEFPAPIVDDLKARGHEISVSAEAGLFGRGQIIWRNDDGVLCGGTEKRTDGTIAAY